ncbi:hypothetical protein Csa_011472 [Cucumis sativus]|uniref:Uncharacterized protein n=1 Tax=Cucumis sativus TaxID=3659 RepID=A0A0A0LAF6_CUCSA|nr:hypothetical protein Csa_011472 [Cucumis sativus]
MEGAEVDNMGIKDYVKEEAKESEKIYMSERLCNKKKKRRLWKKQNIQVRKEDLEVPTKSTSSPGVDFTWLATRTPTRFTKGIHVLRRRSKGREWEPKVGEDVAEEFENKENRNTLSEEFKKEEILEHSMMLLWAQVEDEQNGKLGPQHHPYGNK